MKSFEEQNYYEMLDLTTSASPFDIRHAYKTALQIYGDDAPASYSFFSRDERAGILANLERAFLTLISDQGRIEYDRSLITAGLMQENEQYRSAPKKPIPLFDLEETGNVTRMVFPHTEKAIIPPAEFPVIRDIMSKDSLTGQDLRCIRMELGISLEQIAEIIKVRRGLLTAIEEDRCEELPSMLHLKSFLRAYAEYLRLDSNEVAARYLKQVSGGLQRAKES
ncbi:MAG: helix-turn-helix domain-containing protein [Deltaproteobacteria bacterium]|nr:helix-turn-helix domain-containing protein [Deltaproteobacteria bacterium]